MKRIVVIGCGGSGKTTLARKMSVAFDLPLYHLDKLYWKPNWVYTPENEWREIQKRICNEPKWIMDGTSASTLDIRLVYCDLVVFLDLPRRCCIVNVLKRYFYYRSRKRDDLPDSCPERIDLGFLSWIWNFNANQRPIVLDKLSKVEEKKEIVILKSKKDIDQFVASEIRRNS